MKGGAKLDLRAARPPGPSLTLGMTRFCLLRDDQLHPAVLLSARRGVVRCHGGRLAEAGGGDAVGGDAAADDVVAHD